MSKRVYIPHYSQPNADVVSAADGAVAKIPQLRISKVIDHTGFVEQELVPHARMPEGGEYKIVPYDFEKKLGTLQSTTSKRIVEHGPRGSAIRQMISRIFRGEHHMVREFCFVSADMKASLMRSQSDGQIPALKVRTGDETTQLSICELDDPFVLAMPLYNTDRASMLERFKACHNPEGDQYWTGFTDYEEAWKKTPDEYIDETLRLIEKVSSAQTVSSIRIVRPGRIKGFGEQGSSLRPGVLNGSVPISKAFYTSHRSPVRSKDVDLLIDQAANGGSSYETFRYAGATAFVVAEKLVSAGYNVRIMAFDTGVVNGTDTITVVKVKDYTEPLDLERCTKVIMSALWYRTVNFLALYGSCGASMDSGLGRAMNGLVAEEVLRTAGMLSPQSHLIHMCYEEGEMASTAQKALNHYAEQEVSHV